MKKIYLSAVLASMSTFAMSQSLFETTTYRGAFAPAPTAMWTDGWTNWNPQTTVYGTPNVTVNANITTNTTWTANNVYLIQGQIYVKNNATLTIEPGTVILASKEVAGTGLFITQGAKINAAGTAEAPIVFTSNQAPGSRALGDWGGLILLGRAANNQPGGIANIEGIAPSADTQYGGGTVPTNNDNSGVLTYVRVEFPGYVYQTDKEINGITFGSVGSQTTVHHIQVSYSNDDAYEWFGGSMDAKYLVSYRNLDDDFDTDNGFSGHIQYGLIVRDPNVADNPTISTSEGFESDNDASGSTSTPQTSPIFTNITAIGPFRGNNANTVAAGYRRGVRMRRNTALKIYNSIFMDYPRGIHIDGAACEGNAGSGTLKFRNNIIAGTLAGRVTEKNSGSTFDIIGWFDSNNNDSLVATAGLLTTPYSYLTPDYRPAANSIALTGSDFTDPAIQAYVSLEEISVVSNVTLFPNPTAGDATIVIDLKNDAKLDVVIMNANGQVVQTIGSANYNTGVNEVKVNAAALPQGLYFAVVSAEGAQQTIRFSVVK